jgi:hypothetical protein
VCLMRRFPAGAWHRLGYARLWASSHGEQTCHFMNAC